MSARGVCCLLLLLSVSVCFWVPAACYSNGKVTKACGSMEPQHGLLSNTSHSPYQLQTNTTAFSPGDSIQVVLSGTSYFEGFLLQARDATNQVSVSTVGTFTLTNPTRTQLLTCNKVQGSAVSHTTDSRQTEVVVIWNAPKDSPKVVQFLVTVVARFNLFWVKLPGPIIYQHGVTPVPPRTTTTATTAQTTSPSILPGPSVMFELSGPAEGYVAFALSYDTWMGNDDVYMCIKDEDGVSVSAAFLRGRTHPEDQSQAGLSSVSWQQVDGRIQCRFSRAVKLTDPDSKRFDLDQNYFLFLASGQAQYGALMLLAWMLTGSVGTFIASFYKPDWPNQTLLGQKVWFQVHRGLMMLTVGLTAVSFCLPFFYRKGWSTHAGVHPYLGCCVLTLALIQPIMAAFRPSPDSHRRFIFNWAHWGVGSATEILAVAAMFLGTRQTSLLLPLPWAMYVLIGYVCWMASFRLLLWMHKRHYIKRYMTTAWRSDDQLTFISDQSEAGRWWPFIKSTILAAFVLGNAGLLMALLSSIAEL